MINNSKGWGGAEELLLSLATRLKDHGHHVGVFIREGSATVDRFSRADMDVWPIPRKGLEGIAGIGKMLGIVRKQKFDLIHAHRNHDLPIARLASLVAGAPLLLTQHCQLGRTSSFLINLADRIVAVSRFIGSDMEARYPVLRGKVEVIHNGIDLRPFANPRPGFWQNVPAVAGAWPLLGVVGYFYKNQEELIEILPRIREVLPEAKLVIIGRDDVKQPVLEQRARDCGVADAVCFAGKIPHEQIGDALAGLDFNVSAFRREGCALNVIESLAVGTPFVGYRAGSYPELVEDGVTGGLADNREEFVRIIASLMGQPEKLQQMRSRAKADAFARFALERMVERYETLYRQIGNCT